MTIDTDPGALRAALTRYQRPDSFRSVAEIVITAVPLAVLWGAAFYAVSRGWWWGVLLTVPAACFLVRLFMIQHDCGHSAFFQSRAANTWVGRTIGVLTMTPYAYWRRTHAIHHATSGNLDRREIGGVDTLTVEEYAALTPARRLGYRLYRHPVVMFGLGPAFLFVLQHRLPIGLMKEPAAWLSVLGTNLALAAFMAPLILLGGAVPFLAVHLPTVVLAASIGVWLFYVQHQFEGAYWVRNGAWSLQEAAIRGSSHLDLPPVLRWFTANIGAHHAHHVVSRIPFYRLPEVLADHPQFSSASRITIGHTVKAAKLALWDESAGRLVSFREARALLPRAA